jgi:hypothetical protein
MTEFNSFKLDFDPASSNQYPHGYWYAYARTNDNGWEAIGPTIESTLATMVKVLLSALTEKSLSQ